jgi:hypothetical protein
MRPARSDDLANKLVEFSHFEPGGREQSPIILSAIVM